VFSARTPADLAPNRLTIALDKLRADGRRVVDLTESNPTRAGFEYPGDLLAGLGDPRALTYNPRPFGLLDARRAVAREYARRGIKVSPDRIVLTTSTSEAYGLLFKLLADAGDEVLVPRPSYPLFDHLTRLELVNARPYGLDCHGGWRIDFASVERALTSRTRAILIVSPNNPTGSFVKADEVETLARLSADRGIALIADEVFADYELTPDARAASGRVLNRRDVLAFSLGGLSKSGGLPQVKLAWIAAAGPDGMVGTALERLELICDTYLSVSTPVQVAAAELVERAGVVREQIARRVKANYRWLCERAASAPACRVLASEGGWYAILQVPSLQSEETLVVDLLENDGVLTHPGYFFDFPSESYLIVSLLVAEEPFAEGIGALLQRFACLAGAHD
jgi:aspartate/methionine/tyrosine aminotransferase